MRFLVCALLVIASCHAKKACTPGEIRQDGLNNTCLCSSNGLGWTKAPAPGTCVPGTRFNHYCNECYCLEDGLVDNAVCTKLTCDPNKWNEHGTHKYPEDDETSQENEYYNFEGFEDDFTSYFIHPLPRYLSRRQKFNCVPGKITWNDCNYCICKMSYTRHCTNKVCNLEVRNENGTKKSDVPLLSKETPKKDDEEGSCNIGEIFKNFCNYCLCGKDGTIAGAFCTDMACNLEVWNKNGTMKSDFLLPRKEQTDKTPKHDLEKGSCNSGKMFKDYCNDCLCGIDETIAGALCTNKICDLKVWNKNGTKKSDVALLNNERSVESPKLDIF